MKTCENMKTWWWVALLRQVISISSAWCSNRYIPMEYMAVQVLIRLIASLRYFWSSWWNITSTIMRWNDEIYYEGELTNILKTLLKKLPCEKYSVRKQKKKITASNTSHIYFLDHSVTVIYLTRHTWRCALLIVAVYWPKFCWFRHVSRHYGTVYWTPCRLNTSMNMIKWIH